MRRAWCVIWRLLVFLVLWGMLLAPAVIPVATSLQSVRAAGSVTVQLYMEVAPLSTLLGATALVLRFIERRPLSSVGLQWRHALRHLTLGVAVGAAWLIVTVAVLWLAGWASIKASPHVSWPLLAGTAVAVACNAATQELLARGYIFQVVQEHANTLSAVVGTSVLFVVLHYGAVRGHWLPAVNVLLASLLFTIAYLKARDLWLPIGVHFSWNALLGTVFGGVVSGIDRGAESWHALHLPGPELWTGGAFGMEGGLATTMSTLVGCAILLGWRREAATVPAA